MKWVEESGRGKKKPGEEVPQTCQSFHTASAL